MKRSRGPIDQRARARKRNGGKLAQGRASGTRESLRDERAVVMQRAARGCELCAIRGRRAPATDFAHVVARSQGGTDSRFNAVGTCNRCNLAMQGPFALGRPLVTVVTRDGVRGFAVEWVQATSKFHYRTGDYITLACGFIRAELA
jgi:hypothetical protein